MQTTIKSIAAGKAIEYKLKEKVFLSAYKKDIFLETCEVNSLGIIDDEQAAKEFHGGVDAAIHIGSTTHFDRFQKLYDKELDKLAIGCNMLIDNFDESDICVGDIYCVGEIKLEVSQPRQPCWKIGAIFDKDTNRYIVKQGATGWYVRVLNDGILDSNNPMVLEKRVSDLTIKELNHYLHTPPADHTLIHKILNTDALAQAYKKDFSKVLGANNC